MKVKTSITLDKKLIEDIETLSGGQSRSRFIETAISEQIRQMKLKARDARELALINRNAQKLNREAADALSYQISL